MVAAFKLILSMLPAPVQVFVLGVLGLFIFVLAFKIIAFVLDSIPFL